MKSRSPFAVRLFGLFSRMVLPKDLTESHGVAAVDAFGDLYERARARGLGAVASLVFREGAGLVRVSVTARREGSDGSTAPNVTSGLGGEGDPWLLDAWRDVKHGFRVLRAHPGYSIVVVLTLALGIASSAGVFTVVNGALFRPLPYSEPDRLVQIWSVLDASTEPSEMTVSPVDFTDWRERARGFTGLAAHNLWFPVISGGEGDAQRVLAGLMTTDLLDVLGVGPLLGRTFQPDEGRSGGTRVTILSYGLWRSRYGSDPGILGRTILLNGDQYEVVGVMPPTYKHPDPHRPLLETALFAPFDVEPWPTQTGRFLRVVGRLGPDVGRSEAQAEMDALMLSLQTIRPVANHDVGASVVSLHDEFYGSSRAGLYLVLAGAGALFLIVCANVANLVLARTLARKREFAVRASLGAGRRRIAKQLMIENGILAVAGGVTGLVLVFFGMNLIRGVQGRFIPMMADIRMDLAVSAFVVAMAVITTLFLGALPLLEIFRAPVRAVLGEESAGGGGSRRTTRLRSTLVVAEVALAAALVAGAGLLGRSFEKLAEVDPGFDAERLLTLELTPPRGSYPDRGAVGALRERVRERLAALPGADVVGYASQLPMLDGDWTSTFDVVGQGFSPEEYPDFEMRYVSPDYFRAMGVPVVGGRPFQDLDGEGAPRVVIVNEELASRYWPPGQAVGKQLRWSEFDEEVRGEIVGVVADVLDSGLAGVPDPFVYFPIQQRSNRSMAFLVRTGGDPLSLARAARATVRELDPGMPIEGVDSYANRISESIAGSRFATGLAAAFSMFALILAGLGIYGVLAYSVGSRTREIGIRTALGAQRGDVARMIVRHGMLLTAVGLILGLALAAVEGRVLESLLFGISAVDPLSLALAPAMLLTIALLASYLPARRALAVEPVEALKGEGR